MGKLTRIVYVCDLCGTESNDELAVCSCGKDFCNNCKGEIKASIIKVVGDISDRMLNYYKIACKECIVKVTLKDIFTYKKETGEFSVAARD